MIVDQFNTTLSGGAAVAAKRLHHALLESGIFSRLFYLQQKNGEKAQDQNCFSSRTALSSSEHNLFTWSRQQLQKLKNRTALRGRQSDREMFSCPEVFPHTQIDVANLGTDIIQLHWISKLIDYTSFFASIPDDFPIVWTLHDMNPFTGGCHHADECRQFTSICQHCPQLGQSGLNDLSQRNFETKQQAFYGKNIHIVTPSHWLENHVRSSALLGSARSIRTIRHGLDVNLFATRNREAARKRFGLSEDQFVIGFGAASLSNRRKGFEELLQSLALLKNRDRCVGLAMGDGKLPIGSKILPALSTTGYLDNAEAVADFYAALDVFATTSMAESMGLVIAEAMASGVPVVAFAVGAIPEIVQPHRTGLLATLGDCAQFGHHLNWLAERPDACKQLGREAQELAFAEFDQQKQTDHYIELYEHVTTGLQYQLRVAA